MEFCFSAADILLPDCDMKKWAVIACDQYTSEPEYWQKVKETAGDSPSAFNLILPEVYLKDDNSGKIKEINESMASYQKSGLFKTYKDSMVFVTRTMKNGSVRRGIVGKIDLSQYDYHENTDAAIRATEKTVVSRIPPRVEIRKNAPLELPHIMLLIDDPECTVIENAAQKSGKFTTLYDFDLMLSAGHIKGELIDGDTKHEIISALKALSDKSGGFLFSVGDGNHSLATAKECYNLNKTEKSRYALVEVVNIHDASLEFEPIYRIVKSCDAKGLVKDFVDYCGGEYTGEGAQEFTCIYKNGQSKISVKGKSELCVGTLQKFLDEYQKPLEIDYIHGEDSLKKLAENDNCLGFIFKGMEKAELFKSVAADGSLPRKTFSMGHADDKRFYVEAREIR